jgi:halogenation protein CepH
MAPVAKVELQGVSRTFPTADGGSLHAVDGVSLAVEDGEFIALVGPSGCGKSTLLNMLAGFDRPDAGTALIDGQPVAGPSRNGILITQRGSVFPWMTVRRNLEFATRDLDEAEVARRFAHYIDFVGLRGFEDAWPHQLSGGMLQRVEVARALMAKPDVLFMDEPFGALDALTRMRMRGELLEILARDRHTCLLVTHDVEEAIHLADRIVVFSPRPARVQAVFEVPVPHPRTLTHPALVRLKEEVLRELGLSTLDLLRDDTAAHAPTGARSLTPEERVAPAELSVRPASPPIRIGGDAVEQFDVVVVGGGPGGASCATVLAQEGLKVCLLEREHFPRPHVGESLLPAIWELFDRLGVTAEMESEGFTVKQGISFTLPDQSRDLQLLISEYPEYFPRPYTYHVERARFDEILLHNARDKGATVREGWTVRDVLFQGDRAVGVLAGPNDEDPHPILAPMVVDATGQACLLSRKLGWRRPDPALNKVSHYACFDGGYRPGLSDAEPEIAPGAQTTGVHTIDGGWLWYIPLRHNTVSVGAVLDARHDSGVRGSPQARFDHAIHSSPLVAGWLAGARQKTEIQTISNISYLNDRFVGNGFALIGDASMFVDPIFSSGVTMAMRSGVFAAEAILDCAQAGDYSAKRLEAYEARIRLPMSRIFKMIYNWYTILEKKEAGDLFIRARQIPFLRERLLVLLSGGYDRVDFDSLLELTGESR